MHRLSRTTRFAVEILEERCVASATIIDLGAGFVACSINNSGLVAGSAHGHASLWKDGAILDLGTLGGATSIANDINDAGHVVGRADTLAGTGHAFLVTPEDADSNGQPDRWFRDDDANGVNDLMLDLGTLGGPTSEARGINNLGQVVGRADLSTAAVSYRAFVWSSATGMQNLGTFAASPYYTYGSEANAINNRGQVTGSVYQTLNTIYALSGVQGFTWDAAAGGALLGSLFAAQKATGINDAGQVVGSMGYIASSSMFSRWYAPTDAFLWQNGVTTHLGFSVPLSYTNPADPGFKVSINKNAQVVGLNTLWQDGVRLDLNGLVDPSLDWTVATTSDINDAGMIVGQGTHAGVNSSFLLDYGASPSPRITIGDRNVTEGHTGAVNAVFTVTLSRPIDQAATVDFATSNGSAAGSDFQAASGTLTFNPGETSKTITVLVNGDRLAEANETFQLSLSSPVNATIDRGQGVGTIIDDEPRISIGDMTKAERKKGLTTLFTFTVTLSAAYDQAVTMSFRTVDGSAKTSDSDYVAKTGTLTFHPGETTKTITIVVNGDGKKEANETFYLDLFGLSNNALFTKKRSIGTILNDD